MSVIKNKLKRHKSVSDDSDFEQWFGQVADFLLNQVDLMVNGDAHRFVEIEFYYYGGNHKDPFAHRDPVQLHLGRWYFHRTKGEYRGGSFKGLDVSFGDGEVYAGVLIRSIMKSDGTLVDGPSLSVDTLLDQTGAENVAALDKAINAREIWDESSPLHVCNSSSPRENTIYQSARVGLTLKKGKGRTDMAQYVMRPYRFVSEPRKVVKGRPHLVLGLHIKGEDQDTIQELTGCAHKSIDRYIEDFEAGKKEPNFDSYIGTDLNTTILCRLHGTWHRHMSGQS